MEEERKEKEKLQNQLLAKDQQRDTDNKLISMLCSNLKVEQTHDRNNTSLNGNTNANISYLSTEQAK